MIWFDYEQRELMLWFIALGLTVGVWVYALARRKVQAGMIFPVQRLEGLKMSWRVRFVHAPLIIRSFAFTFILLALTRPQITQEESAEVEGIDIVIAMDVSGSIRCLQSGPSNDGSTDRVLCDKLRGLLHVLFYLLIRRPT